MIVTTLVELADNLVDDYDVIDVLTLLSSRCVEAVDVDAAGVLLASPAGDLRFVASSSESTHLLELFEVQSGVGPSVECFRSGEPIANLSLEDSSSRWPLFAQRAIDLGFHAVHCLPMRLRGRTLGVLNLLRADAGRVTDEDIVVAQGLADIATIAIVQRETTMNAQRINDQLNIALNSRIIIEQAKGMISQAARCDVDVAFGQLRNHARSRNLRLTDVASSIVAGSMRIAEL